MVVADIGDIWESGFICSCMLNSRKILQIEKYLLNCQAEIIQTLQEYSNVVSSVASPTI